jgi:hypothetical protein
MYNAAKFDTVLALIMLMTVAMIDKSYDDKSYEIFLDKVGEKQG